MIEFALAVFFLLITPGPGVLSTAGVGSAYGSKAGTSYVGGLWLGNNLVALAVVTGLAATLLATPMIRTVLMALSVAYLGYLALKIAFSGSKLAFIHPESAPGFRDGLALQAINPKAYAVNSALFTGFAFMPEALEAEAAIKLAILNLFWIPIHFLWLWAGITVRRMELAPGVQRAINIAMALSMVMVVVLALLSVS